MIKVEDKIIDAALKVHRNELFPEIISKRDVIKIAINHVRKPKSKKSEDSLKLDLDSLNLNKNQLKVGLNWFLKSDTKSSKCKITKYDSLSNFFDPSNRDFDITNAFIKEVKRIIKYFTDTRISYILTAKPEELENELKKFQAFSKTVNSKKEVRTRKKIVDFLFSYSSFSKVTKTKYDAYDLCKNLGVEACLYCNRNFIQTVIYNDDKIIRPELDHFIPQVNTSLLKVSFYNLIPSCHFCNSSLKGKISFNLKEYFHPYYGSFDDHKVYFRYKPTSPKAFFKPSDKILDIKLDTKNVSWKSKKRIEKNIKVFKIDQIYDYNISIVEDLQKIKRLSNKNYLEWIRTKVFIDSAGQPKVSTVEEIYELVMMNYYDSKDYIKKPMAKFTKDISEDIGLLPKKRN